jgi:hypothetical protein
MTGLTGGTLYYVRAYATNSAGTAYGNELSFTTLTTPTVSTSTVTAITQTTATSGGNVTSDGGAAVTARGVCWSITPSPAITGNHTSDGVGSESFVSSISGLTPNTIYYVRAYATNSAGTSYGTQQSFTTLKSSTLATITTNAITNIQTTAATCGGNVTSDGGAALTTRGVCWSTSQNPTISNPSTNDGYETGAFTSYITGLKNHTRYYVRAYATNINGTAYGNQVSFTTLRTWPKAEDMSDTIVSVVESGTLKLYPNPVRSTLTIEFDLSESSNVNLSVYNVYGIKMYAEQINDQPSGDHNLQLNTSSFSEGMYVVLLTTNKMILKKNFIKLN